MKRTISAVLCAALALTLAGCAEEKEPMLDRTVTVETTAAQTGELSTESTYIGTISAEGTASVVSLVSGNVEEVMVSVGDTVSAGDPLCRIDDESARLALQNAQAAYQSARESYNSAQAGYGGADLPVLEEQLRLAQDNYEDTQHLFEMGARLPGGGGPGQPGSAVRPGRGRGGPGRPELRPGGDPVRPGWA